MDYSRTVDGYKRKYAASTTELFLEEICKSFGTELLQARIDDIRGIGSTMLTRVSNPSIIEHPNGKKKLIQFQYTIFSPLHDYSRITEVYNKNRIRQKGKRKISRESVLKEITKQHEKWDSFSEVTDERYIEYLNLHRWEKGLYFAVYDVDYDIEDTEGIEGRIKPFSVHEPFPLNKKLPELYITFYIKPYFVIGNVEENTKDIYDDITIRFPQIENEHNSGIRTALSLHPLDKLDKQKTLVDPNQEIGEERIFKTYKIHSEVPKKLTMGFIRAYLRKFCLDKEFY